MRAGDEEEWEDGGRAHGRDPIRRQLHQEGHAASLHHRAAEHARRRGPALRGHFERGPDGVLMALGEGIRSEPRVGTAELVDLVRSLRASRWQIFTKILERERHGEPREEQLAGGRRLQHELDCGRRPG